MIVAATSDSGMCEVTRAFQRPVEDVELACRRRRSRARRRRSGSRRHSRDRRSASPALLNGVKNTASACSGSGKQQRGAEILGRETTAGEVDGADRGIGRIEMPDIDEHRAIGRQRRVRPDHGKGNSLPGCRLAAGEHAAIADDDVACGAAPPQGRSARGPSAPRQRRRHRPSQTRLSPGPVGWPCRSLPSRMQHLAARGRPRNILCTVYSIVSTRSTR